MFRICFRIIVCIQNTPVMVFFFLEAKSFIILGDPSNFLISFINLSFISYSNQALNFSLFWAVVR